MEDVICLFINIDDVNFIQEQVTSVIYEPSASCWHLRTDTGNEYTALTLILATGNPEPDWPCPVERACLQHEGHLLIKSAWMGSWLDHCESEKTVLLIGGGLTAMDAVYALGRAGHRGNIHLVTPSGILPPAQTAWVPAEAVKWPDDISSASAVVRFMLGHLNQQPQCLWTDTEWQSRLESLRVHLNPVWFDHSSGWNGGSHMDAETFCNTKGNNAPMTLCPYDAYCPNGPTFSALGGPNMDFATQEQYAPYHGDDDHWVLIGRFNNAKTTTCLDYMQLFGEIPSWTKDDSRKELKQHVLCCDTSETLQSSSVVGIQTSSTSSTTSSTDAPPKVESQFIEIDDTPGTWFGVSDGWEGGSRIDAIKFCYNKGEDADGIPMMLCPFEGKAD